jgi:mono/diheme cytochrome c family protein
MPRPRLFTHDAKRTKHGVALARRAAALILSVPMALFLIAGCRGQTSGDPPVQLERNMFDTERYNPESFSAFFPDHRTMRTPVEGTVARDWFEPDSEATTGLMADKTEYTMTVPQVVITKAGGMEKLLVRGRERFGIYCAPCHGLTGDGKGIVVCKRAKVTDPCESRGFPPLPSYEDPRLRQMPDGQLFATITHGVRSMPAYGAQVPTADRWAIVAYVRALELSQMAEASPSQMEPRK